MRAKTAVMQDVGKMVVKELEVREPGPGEVLVRIYNCNICTTDWQTWAGLRASQGRRFPWAPGHEMGGEVIQVGPGVKNVAVGTRVGFSHNPGCGQCIFCRRGHPSRCQNRAPDREVEGITGSFGMAQYFLATANRVYPMSSTLPYEEIGYLEPLATAIHGVRRLRVSPGEDVLVIGAGNLGLVNAQVARAFGARVLVSEINEQRCKVAESLGFPFVNPAKSDIVSVAKEFSRGKGMDAVILAVGSTAANDQALSVLAPMGRVLFFAAGYPHPELHADPNTIHYREFELIGTFGADPRDFQLSSEFLSNGTVKVDKLISYRVPLDDVQKAFELAATPGNYRVSLVMW